MLFPLEGYVHKRHKKSVMTSVVDERPKADRCPGQQLRTKTPVVMTVMQRKTLRPIAIWGNLVSFYCRGMGTGLFHNVVENVNSRGRQSKVRYVQGFGGGVECCVYRLYEGEGEVRIYRFDHPRWKCQCPSKEQRPCLEERIARGEVLL